MTESPNPPESEERTAGAATPHTPVSPDSPTPETSAPAPTPGSVNKDVPAERWRAELAATADAPAADRHHALSALLDDLDPQVGSL